MSFVKTYGFPRSGSHLLMTLIGANFYPSTDLTSPGGQVGHWADRVTVPPVEYGQLAGHHGPPSWGYDKNASVYIYRDGRAVAASLYRSPHFKHPANAATFSEFIRQPLDWQWTVGNKWPNTSNVIDHWREHLSVWKRTDVLAVRYEDLARYPATQISRMLYVYKLDRPDEWTLPDKLVGWFPSGGKRDGWRELWNDDDEAWFYERVPREFYGVMEAPF